MAVVLSLGKIEGYEVSEEYFTFRQGLTTMAVVLSQEKIEGNGNRKEKACADRVLPLWQLPCQTKEAHTGA